VYALQLFTFILRVEITQISRNKAQTDFGVVVCPHKSQLRWRRQRSLHIHKQL